MRVNEKLRDARAHFSGLTFYERFEHAVVLVLTGLLVIVVGVATWRLALGVLALVLTEQVDPANQQVFQTVFGMIFTVLIALEFKHSLLIVLSGQESIVRVRTVMLIAMLAMVRKFIILDLKEAAPTELFALAASIPVRMPPDATSGTLGSASRTSTIACAVGMPQSARCGWRSSP